MPAPGGQPSDSHIHMDPAIRPQDNENPLVGTGIDACQRALFLLAELQTHQTGLCRSAALAWERRAFAQAFEQGGPRERIRAFLEKPRR
jgi:hypothetical protein